MHNKMKPSEMFVNAIIDINDVNEVNEEEVVKESIREKIIETQEVGITYT